MVMAAVAVLILPLDVLVKVAVTVYGTAAATVDGVPEITPVAAAIASVPLLSAGAIETTTVHVPAAGGVTAVGVMFAANPVVKV